MKKTRWEVREMIAESGKMVVKDVITYLDRHWPGQYDKGAARADAKEMIAEARAYNR